MEADWEVEIGPGAPVIEALWPGFLDLRADPSLVDRIAEARDLPALAQALVRINGPSKFDSSHSTPASSRSARPVPHPLWTTKCDLFRIDTADSPLDPDELNATPEQVTHASAAYLDLLPRAGFIVFPSLEAAVTWARSTVAHVRTIHSLQSRVDLIVRRAVAGPAEGFGITAYLIGCGPSNAAATDSLSAVLNAFSNALCL